MIDKVQEEFHLPPGTRAAIAECLEKQPKDVKLPTEREQRDVENAFWLRMDTAIQDAAAGKIPE